MVGVSFYFSDTPPNIKRQLLKSQMILTQVCRDHCNSYGICKSLNECPKFTLQTIYIIKYLSLQSLMSNTIYPYPGTWLDQPEWYLKAFNIGLKKLNDIKSKNNKGTNNNV